MSAVKRVLTHPLWGSVALLAGAYVLVAFGIPSVPALFGVESAPVPASVVWQYMLTVLLAILLYVSAEEKRWAAFRAPLQELLGAPEKGPHRAVALVLAAGLVGWFTYRQVQPSYGAPPGVRSIHPAPPSQITFRGETMRLSGLSNPLRKDGEIEEDYLRGREIYVENCVPCHGDHLDGDGQFAGAFNPTPLDFSGGTIGQLSESFVFWRIAKGGPGLPSEGTPWNSAMPAWEPVLDAEQIWSVVVFLYEQTGIEPRALTEEGEGGEGSGTEASGEGAP